MNEMWIKIIEIDFIFIQNLQSSEKRPVDRRICLLVIADTIQRDV